MVSASFRSWRSLESSSPCHGEDREFKSRWAGHMPICRHCGDKFPNHILLDGMWKTLNSRKFCLTCSPFGKHNTKKNFGSSPSCKNSDESIREAVGKSLNYYEVFRRLRMSGTGSGYATLKKRIVYLRLDVSHFDPIAAKREAGGRNRYSDEDVYRIDSPVSPSSLKKHVLKSAMIPYQCVCCENNGFHNGKSLVLQLDHKNGVRNDNRLENLRFLCPNCHSQTDTFCRSNRPHGAIG